MEKVIALGQQLFDAVFSGALRDRFRVLQEQSEPAGVRIRLNLSEAPELLVLPWEYLFDRDDWQFLALSEKTPVVRCLDVAKSIGVDPKIAKAVVYPGGGPARAAFLGGHIDVYMASPLSMIPLQEEGKVRILAMSSAQRQTGRKASIPTFREQGVDAVFATWRGFMSPKGLKPGEIAYWDGIFEKLAQSEEWRKELDKQMWLGDYTLSAETRKHLDRENEVMKAILADLGLIKQQ